MVNKPKLKIDCIFRLPDLNFRSWLMFNKLSIHSTFEPFIDRIEYFFNSFDITDQRPDDILVQVCCMGLICVLAENRLQNLLLHTNFEATKKVIAACESMKIILSTFNSEDKKFSKIMLDFYIFYEDFKIKALTPNK